MGLKNTYQARKRFTKVPVDKTGMWYQDKDVVVPSNRITMKGPNGESNYFNSPILGTGMQSGQTQVMYPGREYSFPNDNSVYERKMQNGGSADPEFMFREKYNTKLTPSEEADFYRWAVKESKKQNRDILQDIGAYDVKGFWKSGDYRMMDSDNHGADTWKKPNHPTFSNQSRYHGADGWYGGNWTDKAGYQPSKQTLEVYGPDYYDWMFKAEPGRSEYLDMSRYESGANTPTPFIYQEGGHVIQSGETFYGIANKYGFDKEALTNANPGLDIDKLRPGQKINLPTVEKIGEVTVSSKDKREPTQWYNYLNPLNWGSPNYDDAGGFSKAFRKARKEGEDDFMWYGKRYSSDLAKLPDSKKAIAQTSEVEEGIVFPTDTTTSVVTPTPTLTPQTNFKGNQLDLDNVLTYLVNTRGGDRNTWTGMADTIAYHESAHSMDPKQKQIGGGPGRGMFQFEKPTFNTFKNRYKNVAKNLKLQTDPNILQATSADQLTPEQQYTTFLVNMLESNATLKDYPTGQLSLEDVWLSGHKNVEKEGDRKSFQTSVEKARSKGITGGYNSFENNKLKNSYNKRKTK